MVGIVAGNGLGLLNTSLNILGGAGVLGQSALGQGGGRAYRQCGKWQFGPVNAGRAARRSRAGSLRAAHLQLPRLARHRDEGDGWRWGYEQTVRFQGPGTPALPHADATVIRTTGDGHETTYAWNADTDSCISAPKGPVRTTS